MLPSWTVDVDSINELDPLEEHGRNAFTSSISGVLEEYLPELEEEIINFEILGYLLFGGWLWW